MGLKFYIHIIKSKYYCNKMKIINMNTTKDAEIILQQVGIILL